jgi:carboxylesterase
MEGATEGAYAEVPLRSLRSLLDGAAAVEKELAAVTCPVLLFSSAQDHVVDPVSGDRLVAGVGGPVERVVLERSFHVATLDYDRDEIEARAVKFVTDLLPSSGA